MRRIFSLLALAGLLVSPIQAQQKPLVSMGGQTRQLPPGTTLGVNAATTGAASLNIPAGVAPTSPNNGDCWTTTAGLTCRANGVNVTSFVRVPTNAALTALPSSLSVAMRTGYAANGDVPPLLYSASNSTCTLNAGAGDGGSQVPTSDGKCWLANWSSGGVSIAQFGAIPNDGLDDGAAIQQAFNYGGGLNFPDGDYRVASTLTISKQVSVTANPGAMWLVSTTADNVVLRINGPTPESGAARVTLNGIQFGTALVRTGGSYVEVTDGVYNVTIKNARFERAWIGIHNTGAPGYGLYLQDIAFYYPIQGAILLDNDANGSVDQIFENINIFGPADGSSDSQYGIKVVSAGDLRLNNVSTVKAGKGLWIAPTAGKRIQLMYVEGCFFDSGQDWGVDMTTDGGNIDAINFLNTWSGTNLGGFRMGATGNGGQIRQASILSSIGSNNVNEGFLIGANAANVTIGQSWASGNGSDGFRIAPNTVLFKIIGSTAAPSGEFPGNGGMGINVQTGTSDRYIIMQNFVSGNTGTNIVDGGSGPNKFIANNI